MVRFLFSLMSALSLAACNFAAAIERAALCAVACVASVFEAGPALDDAGQLAYAGSGAPLDASLLHGLRHEAHVRRRSADRNV